MGNRASHSNKRPAVPLDRRHQMVMHRADAAEAAGVLVRDDPIAAHGAPLRQDARDVLEAGPPRWPLVGHLPAFLHDKLGFLTQCAERYGDSVPLQIAYDKQGLQLANISNGNFLS